MALPGQLHPYKILVCDGKFMMISILNPCKTQHAQHAVYDNPAGMAGFVQFGFNALCLV